MSKTIFVNGKYIDLATGTFDIKNIMMVGSKVHGLGYLPDEDDETTVYDLQGCIIVPHLINISLTKDAVISEKRMLESGFGGVSGKAPKEAKLMSHRADFKVIDPDAFETGMEIESGPALFLISNESHIGIASTLKQFNPQLKIAADIGLFYKGNNPVPELVDALKTDVIDIILTQKETDKAFLPLLIDMLFHESEIPLPKIFEKLTKHVYELLGVKKGVSISLFSSPSFSIIDPMTPFSLTKNDVGTGNKAHIGKKVRGRCLAVMVNGALIYSDLKPAKSFEFPQHIT
jgi:hypothetical protein